MNEEKHASFLQDSNLNKSSKRLWGSILLAVGMAFAAILFGISIYKTIADANTALRVVEFFLGVGAGLLGLGVIDNFRRR